MTDRTAALDNALLWVHWEGSVVAEKTVAELAANIRRRTPHVTGVMVKASNGTAFQGLSDNSSRDLDRIQSGGH